MIYDPDYFDCLDCLGRGCDRCGGTGKSNVPVVPKNKQCSNLPAVPYSKGCGTFSQPLLYTTPQKEEMPANRFKIIDANKRPVTEFRVFSSPNGLIIELPKQELFPPYSVVETQYP